ncbi:MAG: ISL3 family transposase [Bacteroidaceae bacterium]|nr:ISL3 family transposase [Bacteroidaceae bacterium]
MLREEDISIEIKSQGYECKTYARNLEGTESVLLFESRRETSETRCPACGSAVHIYDSGSITLRDIPIWVRCKQELCFIVHRYRCTNCKACFTEDVPFKYPGTRITTRAACWVRELLRGRLAIKAVQEITGIHWDTIHRIHKEMMDRALESRAVELREAGYKPTRLAVDEFAIHKGHTYATCVMDLDSGEVIWAGKGRSKEDFKHFFDDMPEGYLSQVCAVAMDMNASYNILFTEKLPKAVIVYDRYHMQAQYGKEVLGVVRLQDARKHQSEAKSILERVDTLDNSEQKRQLKAEAQKEKQSYSQLKKLRWTLLTNGARLSDEKAQYVQNILSDHSDLAVCYAMKEELCALFELTNPLAAHDGWKHWFDAAEASGIPALMKFAELKRSRLDGLVAHATFPISTGRLEGFNNKIKVAKRIGYGYRDDDYFFTLIRYLALPVAWISSHNFP